MLRVTPIYDHNYHVPDLVEELQEKKEKELEKEWEKENIKKQRGFLNINNVTEISLKFLNYNR
jgi:hypothetical protein